MDKEPGNAGIALNTRYPYLLEELSRLASKEAKQLLHKPFTQELRKALSQAIQSFGSSSEITWEWHDQLQSGEGTHLPEEGERGESLEMEEEMDEMDELLADMVGLDKVKKIIQATPSMGPQIQEILKAAVKVIDFCSSINIG